MDEKERIAQLENELARLRTEFAITLGRANGLHLVVLTLARDWGKPAAAITGHLDEAIEAVEATALHTPLPEETLAEQLRVAKQVSQTLKAAAGNTSAR
ncbi:hypothetical protein KIP31_09970 [Xanthomonas campestris pv. campestris]|uniref:hypothetical protein n=1 Tax=Xanthomonas campestris TaxID=339 RepID=UPI001F30D205|nr:hypothetical protein [Xanthomonas campestris]MCF8809643.1 hypothetical protein [Xanthomonas campestris pv. campestris]